MYMYDLTNHISHNQHAREVNLEWIRTTRGTYLQYGTNGTKIIQPLIGPRYENHMHTVQY